MTRSEIVEIAKDLIEQGRVGEALEALTEYAKGRDRYAENDILMQTANYNRNRRDYNNGLITRADYSMVMARLDFALTQIMERLPEEGNEVQVNAAAHAEVAPVAGRNPDDEVKNTSIRKILFLSASPKNMDTLRLGEELRKIKDGLSAATQRDKIKLESEPAVKVPTITKAMQVHSPEIVHFSGHGEGDQGLIVEDDVGRAVPFPTSGLELLFDLFRNDVKCVVLNACYSHEQAKVISKYGIYVVGMDGKIGDSAAINFSVGFYQSIGEGRDYEFAFRIALVNISPNLQDAHRPELWLNGERIR